MRDIKLILLAFWTAILLAVPLLASAGASTDQTIVTASRRLERNPTDRNALLTLGSAYARKGRETGDSRYFGMAQETLRRCVELHPADGAGRRHLAYVLSLQHDFAGAAGEAQSAIDLDPKDADAHGILGDAHIELGNYDNAQKAYDQMIALERSLATLSRRSGLNSLRGDTKAALDDQRQAITLGQRAGEAPESIAWAQWQLGMEYLNVGQLRQAEAAFGEALASFPDYYRGHAGLALVRTARGQFRRAIEEYEKAMAVVPLPEYAIALGNLYTRLGNPTLAADQYALVDRLAALSGDPFNRETIFYRLDHGDAQARASALEVAQKSLASRQDIYAFDTLAWALFHNHHLPEARAAMERALKLGTIDAKLFYHAGVIYQALGERAKSATFLRRALALNANFHVLHAQTARQILRTRTVTRAAGTTPSKI